MENTDYQSNTHESTVARQVSRKWQERAKEFTTREFYWMDIPSKDHWKSAATIFLYWSVPAILFVLLVKQLESIRPVEYYMEAISQGIGPILWNVMGAFGFALFGLSLVWPKWKRLSRAAHHVLLNVYAIGAFSFGLILGQVLCDIPNWGQYLRGWRLVLFGMAVPLLMLAVASINLFIWYLGYLVRPDKDLYPRIRNMSWMWRIPVGLILTSLPLWLLWLED